MLLGRVYRIFQYYAAETARLEYSGPGWHGPSGQVFGRVQRVAVEAGRLVVEGWAEADRVTLRQDKTETSVVPAAQDPMEGPRFRLDLPFAPGAAELVAEHKGALCPLPLAGFSAARLAMARAGRALPFCATLLRLSPVIWRWKRTGDLGAREQVKEALSLVPRSPAGLLDPAVLAPAAARPADPGGFTIVMPVYNGRALTQEALGRVEAHSAPGWHLVLIDDASDEPGLRDWLRHWAAERAERVTLIENDTNQGFVAAANRGLATALRRDPDGPVVLLNSDALVPAGWAERLLAPLKDPRVASVTPFSNDAEIFTVPAISARHALRPGEADRLADRATRIAATAALRECPTGVGFCMALSPRYLSQVPQFDTAFGRGYGEEVDWCRKAIAAGGQHVVAADLFVEHRGGASFGSAEKQRLLRQNSRLLSQRYPGFDAEVRGFVAADPLVTARLALGLSLVADRAGEPVPVWLAHAMGGGAENDLRDRIAARTAAGQAGVVVRVGQGKRWKLELHTAQGKTAGVSDAFEPVAALLARLSRRRIIYSCGVGDRDPAALPGFLLALAGRGSGAIPGGAQPLEVLLHDYFPISPSYTLLGKEGVWRGVPRPDTVAGNDPAHCWTGPGGAEVDLAAWQAGWGAMLEAADRIEVFSAASGAILSQAYPHVGGIVVREHRLPSRPPHLTPGPVTGDQPVIGILGNIGPHKGARIVQQLSRDLARSGAARLVVIGRVAPEYALASWAHVHGPYQIRDLPGLVARYGISAWLIPSVWPETFSFTTHEALATGLPVLAFDLGAQGAAVEAAENGIALPCPGSRGLDPGAVLAALRESAP